MTPAEPKDQPLAPTSTRFRVPTDPITRLRSRLGQISDLKDFSTDPYSAMDRLHDRNGPVSWVGTGPIRFALLLGPEANEFVLGNTDLFSWSRAFEGLVPLAGPGALLVNDGERHRRLRSLVQPAFTARAVHAHVATVRAHVDRVVDTWERADVVEVSGAFRTALRRATIQSLFGSRAVADDAPLQARLQTVHEAIDTSSLVRRVQSLGLPSWKRALAARAHVQSWVAGEIARYREAGGDPERHVLGTLLRSRDADGAGLTEDELSDQLISLLEAGAETTSSAFVWTLYEALADRRVWEALAEEVREHAPEGEELGAEHVERMDLLDRVVRETLRLHPATVVASRMTATPFRFGGHGFGPGSKIVFSPYHTHRLASVWTDPLRFDPGRWDPSGDGYRKPRPHEYLPFGGGPHRCVGAAFATLAVKTAIAQVVRRADLWLARKGAHPSGLIGMRPKEGLTVLVTGTHEANKDEEATV